MIQPIKQKIKHSELSEVASYIFQNAVGNPIVFEAAPTASSEMKGGTWGVFGADMYIKNPNGVLIKLAGVVIP